MPPFVLNKTVIPDQYELLVYGDIGESWAGETVSAKNVAAQIQTLDPKTKQITIRVNSFGGSVADGIAIHNALRQHPAKKKVVIDGVAMSIASLIAMAGDEVEAFDSSIFMLHAPWANISGNASKLRDYADVLDTFAEAMTGAYVRKTGKTPEEIRSLLTDGEDHYFTAEEAKAFGLVDIIKQDTKAKAQAANRQEIMAFAMVKRHLGTASDKVATMAISAALQAQTLDGLMDPETNVAEQPTEAENAAFDKAVQEENVEAAKATEPVVEQPAPAAEPAPAPEAKLDVVKALEEKFAKAQAEAEAKVLAAKAEAEVLAKTLADEREKAEVQASIRHASEVYANLPGKAESLGPALRVLAKTAPEAYNVVKELLDSVNGLLANAEKIQMASVGKVGDAILTPEARLEAEVKKVLEKNTQMTVEQAKAAVYRANPNIVRELRGEKD